VKKDAIDLTYALTLPPEKAVAYFRRLIRLAQHVEGSPRHGFHGGQLRQAGRAARPANGHPHNAEGRETSPAQQGQNIEI